ncbi:MAG: hypothetical protein WA783_19560 [Phormidesmis sp.]
MDKLIPIVLPVFFGLVAGISHGIVSDSMNLPTTLDQAVSQPFLSQTLSE